MGLTNEDKLILASAVPAWLALVYLFSWLALISPAQSMLEASSGALALFFLMGIPIVTLIWVVHKLEGE